MTVKQSSHPLRQLQIRLRGAEKKAVSVDCLRIMISLREQTVETTANCSKKLIDKGDSSLYNV